MIPVGLSSPWEGILDEDHSWQWSTPCKPDQASTLRANGRLKKTGKIIEINGVWGQSGIEIDHRSKGYVVIIPYYIYYPPLEVWNLSLCSVTFGSMIIAIIFHQGVKTTKLFQRSPGMFRHLLCQTVSPGVFMFMNVYDLWAFPRPISSSAWQISILLHLRDFSEFQRLRL